MMARAPGTERSYDTIDILFFVWRAVMILLAAAMGIYGYLTALAAETAKCAGMQWIAGYRMSVVALWTMPLLGIAAIAWVLLRSRRTKITELLSVPRYREILFSVGSIRVTVGALIAYGPIVVSPLLAKQTEFLIVRYHAIASYCRADAVSSGLGIWRLVTVGALTETSLVSGTHARKEAER